MKKVSLFVLAIALSLFLCACKDSSQKAEEALQGSWGWSEQMETGEYIISVYQFEDGEVLHVRQYMGEQGSDGAVIESQEGTYMLDSKINDIRIQWNSGETDKFDYKLEGKSTDQIWRFSETGKMYEHYKRLEK